MLINKIKIKECHYYQGEDYNPYCLREDLKDMGKLLTDNPRAFWWEAEVEVLHLLPNMTVEVAIQCKINKHMEYYPGNEKDWEKSYYDNAIV